MRISPDEARGLMIHEAHVYLDVRSAHEFAGGRPQGAVNVPFANMTVTGLQSNPDFVREVRARVPDLATPLIVGCKAIGRAEKAAALLMGAGYTHVLVQRAGWDGTRGAFGEIREPGWRRRGLPTDP